MTLAKCLQKPEGMAALHAELAAGGETDAAMAFLATAIKDHGAVPASNSLYRSVTLSVSGVEPCLMASLSFGVPQRSLCTSVKPLPNS